jgi:hypothetical protein
MKNIISGGVVILFVLMSCQEAPKEKTTNNIIGTWKLLTGTLIEKGDTIITDYTKDKSFIKIINDSHFAFTLHDLDKGKDSVTATFSAGSGKYSFDGKNYTEHLEYCSAREWEGHDFPFTVIITGDTLVQSGVEKIESAGINRINIEKYVRVKD